jgi:hypothetical protein
VIYVRSGLVGVGLVTVATFLFITIPALVHFDGRMVIEKNPLIFVSITVIVFLIGFAWQLGWEKRRFRAAA